LVISDWAAIDEMRWHGVAADRATCARLAALAGVDMDLASEVYVEELVNLVQNGVIPESVIDEAVRRILRAKFRLGLFAQPYTDVSRAAIHLHPDHLRTVRDAAARSLVLLENDGILPLRRADLAVGVFGPLAKARSTLLGCWTLDGHEDGMPSIFDAIRAKVGGQIELIEADLVDDALKLAPRCDVVIAVVGEGISRSGENNCVTTLDLPPGQMAFLEALHALQVPIVAVVLAGPLAESGMAAPARRSRADGMASRQGRRQRDRRCLVWRCESQRQAAGDLSAQRRTDSAVLQSQVDRQAAAPP
jgi:beta-glucosidase